MTQPPDRPQPQPGIMKIAPYVQGRSDAVPGVTPVKLSANESPLGPSPKVVDALRREAARVHLYPDGGSTRLREALGARLGVPPDWIVAGKVWDWGSRSPTASRACSDTASVCVRSQGEAPDSALRCRSPHRLRTRCRHAPRWSLRLRGCVRWS